MPGDIDERGNLYILINAQTLHVYASDGKLTSRIKFPWIQVLAPSTLGFARGQGQTVWVALDRLKRHNWSRLVNAKDDGTKIWEKRSSQERLFAASNGDIYCLKYPQYMARFNANGRQLAFYDFSVKPYTKFKYPHRHITGLNPMIYSAIATGNGDVYSHSVATLNHGWVNGLWIDHWLSPSQHNTRFLDFDALGYVIPMGLVLGGVDAQDNFYFQYVYSHNERKKDYSYTDYPDWRGPMAVAKASSDGKAHKIFDIYEHYKSEMGKARQQADETRKKRGPITIGDLIHVSANGDLYLEVADATHYRIDKVSFPQQ